MILGPACIGAPPPLKKRGCGRPRVERTTGSPELRWLCARCAHLVALRESSPAHLVSPLQLGLWP